MIAEARVAAWLLAGVLASALPACASHHGANGHEDALEPDPDAGDAPGSMADADAGALVVGARAFVRLEPTSAAAADAGVEPVSGDGTFMATAAGVDFMLTLLGCAKSQPYPVFIQEGSDCSDATLRGAHWDSPRGEGLPEVGCIGVSGFGRVVHSRPYTHEQPWSVGPPARSDLLGHAMVVLDPETLQPIACGVITREEVTDVPEPPPADGGPPTAIRAQLAGLCLARSFARDNTQECPDPDELLGCAEQHCAIDACVAVCADYLACIEPADDTCTAAVTCPLDEACGNCQTDVTMCALNFCLEEIACAAPSAPDGPCRKLEACCAMQGDEAEGCLQLVRTLESLSGDVSCGAAMHDWDVTAHLNVPCNFE